MCRKIFFLMSLLVVLWPSSRVTAVDLDPRFNPICWTKAECAEVRKTFGADAKQAESGWLSEAPCVGEFGKCLPAGITETQVKFGGQTKFKDLGEFLKINYNYLLGIAGILSALMIILGAVQWVASGGSSEAIGSAKKRIAGALIGLLIAYLSFVILTTINPALTNLRLPQVFMVKNTKLTPRQCIQAEGDLQKLKFADVGVFGTNVEQVDPKTLNYNIPYGTKSFACGRQFFMATAGKSPCAGNVCSQAQHTCAFKDNKYSCVKGLISGVVTHHSLAKNLFPDLVTEEWDDPPIDDNETELYYVCMNGSSDNLDTDDIGYNINEKEVMYIIDAELSEMETAFTKCEGSGGLKGYVLRFEMDEATLNTDEYHYIGKKGGKGVDFGDENGFEYNKKYISNKYFITYNDIKNGISLDLEAGNVIDIDSSDNWADNFRPSIKELYGTSEKIKSPTDVLVEIAGQIANDVKAGAALEEVLKDPTKLEAFCWFYGRFTAVDSYFAKSIGMDEAKIDIIHKEKCK